MELINWATLSAAEQQETAPPDERQTLDLAEMLQITRWWSGNPSLLMCSNRVIQQITANLGPTCDLEEFLSKYPANIFTNTFIYSQCSIHVLLYIDLNLFPLLSLFLFVSVYVGCKKIEHYNGAVIKVRDNCEKINLCKYL